MRTRRILAAAGCALALVLCSCAGTPPAGNAPAPETVEQTGDAAATAPAPEAVQITWTEDAWSAFQAEVPKAVQKIAKKQMEKEARGKGISVIDMDFYNEVKKEQGR